MAIVNVFRRLLYLVLLLCLLLCGYVLVKETMSARADSSVEQYKPQEQAKEDQMIEETAPQEEESKVLNPGIVNLQQKENSDIRGWITVDGTGVDYPYVLSRDNEDYLRADLHGNYLRSGTIFEDCRGTGDASRFMTLLYGHMMKNGTMFSDLEKFAGKSFFNNNTTGTLSMPYVTYKLEIVAYLVVNAADEMIYAPTIGTEEEIEQFEAYVKKVARRQRDFDLTAQDKVLVLSTCSYEYTGARSVVIAKMVRDAA